MPLVRKTLTETSHLEADLRRPAIFLTGFAVVLLLGGCSSLARHETRIVTRSPSVASTDASGPALVPSPAASEITETVLAPGSVVTLRNGLVLTVPDGWSATLTRDDGPKPELGGALGTHNASELLVLQRGAHRVRISSSPQSEAHWSDTSPFRPALASTVATAFEIPYGRPGIAPLLGVVRTHVPGAMFGVMVFERAAGTLPESIEGVWRVFRITGAAPPLSPTGRP